MTKTPAAIFECSACSHSLVSGGHVLSPFQIHHTGKGGVICSSCGRWRPLFQEGESIPVFVRRWPHLPDGIPAESYVEQLTGGAS